MLNPILSAKQISNADAPDPEMLKKTVSLNTPTASITREFDPVDEAVSPFRGQSIAAERMQFLPLYTVS
jgi:hypothetical protein